MNKYGIVIHPLLPVRSEASELSEMTTQLLFGELVTILETQDKWLFIENCVDSYQGWVDAKMLESISEESFFAMRNMPQLRLDKPFNLIFNEERNQSKLIPAGSIIYNPDNALFVINDESWELVDSFSFSTEKYKPEAIIELAKQFLNAPYLWGGKSILGVDCSGLTQLVYTIAGYNLPRNSSQQVKLGEAIGFLTEAETGDLAFFGDEEGKITHVGILLDNEHIIHASGWVKLEKIDPYGIVSSSNGEYSHQLKAIRRVIN